MRIGYLVPDFPAQTHAFFWREAQALREGGTDVTFFSTKRPPADACPHAFADQARAETIYLFPPPASALGALALRPGGLARAIAYVLGLSETPLAARLKLLALIPCAMALANACRTDGIDHVHIHSFANSAHIGALAQILTGLEYSLTLHGDLPVYGTDHAAKMQRARLLTAVTRPLAAQIRGVAPKRDVPVIWMGVDTSLFAPKDTPAEPSPDRPLEVISVTRLSRTKGHRYLLEAMAALGAEGIRFRYRIAGDGPERDAILARAKELGLADSVELLGAISQDQVRALLAEADLFALTSFGQGEAAPVAVMEAMSCGVPVICSRIGGTGDMINDGEDGFLVAQEDPENIATAIRRLVTEPGLGAAIRNAARATALSRFDYRVQAQRLSDAMQDAGAGSPAS
ncbi:MAG: exopolysaccharide biosynthesis GT4 family glycosyltransferase EpsE [Pseudomonadota bacterium]